MDERTPNHFGGRAGNNYGDPHVSVDENKIITDFRITLLANFSLETIVPLVMICGIGYAYLVLPAQLYNPMN